MFVVHKRRTDFEAPKFRKCRSGRSEATPPPPTSQWPQSGLFFVVLQLRFSSSSSVRFFCPSTKRQQSYTYT